MISISSSVSCGVRTAVGSSSTSTSALRLRALMISTRCWAPTGRSSTSASGSRSKPKRAEISRTSVRAAARSSRPPLVGSCPSTMFSATVKTGTSMKCWWTIPIPASIASPGSEKVTGFPSMTMSPPSGRYSPYRTFIRVDLPAPFSPSSEWISPGSTTRSMASLATKVPKVFVIPRSSSFTAVASVGAGRAAGPARFGTWCAVPARRQGPRTGQRGSGALRGGLRLDDHVAADDLLLEGLQLLGELRGDLVLEVVVRGQAHAAVLERAHVRGAVELALGGAGDDVLDAHGHLLHDGGEDDGLRLGVGGVGLVAVGVDPDHHAVLALLGGGEGA